MNNQKGGSFVDILLVEDNPGDVRLTKEAFKESKILNKLHVVSDGEEAMAYLNKKGKYKENIHPDLIILDLNLPRMNGREVLAKIKENNDLKRIPVVILTISEAEEDILKTYELYANCYITKPIDIIQFTKVVKSVSHFWFSIVKLPPNGAK